MAERLLKAERGAVAVEYALVLTGVAAAILLAVLVLGASIAENFGQVPTALSAQSESVGGGGAGASSGGAGPPGKTGNTPGQSGGTPGQGGSNPGQSGTTPGQSGGTPH